MTFDFFSLPTEFLLFFNDSKWTSFNLRIVCYCDTNRIQKCIHAPLCSATRQEARNWKLKLNCNKLGNRVWKINTTPRLESNKWKLFEKRNIIGKTMHLEKKKEEGILHIFSFCCYYCAALMESILRGARERCIKCCGGGLARPLIAGIRNATRNVVISKIVSPLFL